MIFAPVFVFSAPGSIHLGGRPVLQIRRNSVAKPLRVLHRGAVQAEGQDFQGDRLHPRQAALLRIHGS
ncbi:MAG: hypothetical protein JO015_12285 [Verrucomicrobia bacterium]|nr:hypothetical protein [Verrucomicrobiota bacterium]